MVLHAGVQGESPPVVAQKGEDLPRRIPAEAKLAYIAAEGYRPLARLEKDAPRRTPTRDGKAAPTAFMEPVYPLGEGVQFEKTKWWLVARNVDKAKDLAAEDYLGWVEEAVLVRSQDALKDPDTGIYRKAIIVTQLESLKEGIPGKISEVPVALSPGGKPDPKRVLRLLNLLFVWADTEPTSLTRGEVLLGSAPIMQMRTDTHLLIGWVPKSRVCIWNTREAFEWNRESLLTTAKPRRDKPARVFNKPLDAHRSWKGEDIPGIFEEKISSQPPPPGQMRYLLLPWPAENEEERKRFKEYGSLPLEGLKDKDDKPLRSQLFHVGVYGGFRSTNPGDDPDKDVIDAEKLEELKAKLRQLSEDTSTLELLFVIDGTSNMLPNGKVVAEMIVGLLNAEEFKGVPLRVAVSVYRDVDRADVDPLTCVETQPLKDLSPESAKEIEKRLRSADFYRDGGDAPEQVFRGLAKSIQEANFQIRTRKAVVLIGDMGNSTKWDSEKHPGVTEKQIAELLNPEKGSPILFFPVQVNIDPEKEEDLKGLEKGEREAALAFRKQMGTILKESQQRREKNKLAKVPAGQYLPAGKSLDSLRKLLQRPVTDLKAQRDQLEREIEDLRQGRFDATIGDQLEKLLREAKIPIDDLRKLQGAQVFRTGYVWERTPNGAYQVSQRLLLSSGEVDQLQQGLAQLRSNDPAGPPVKGVLTLVTDLQTGDKKTNPKEDKKPMPPNLREALFGKLRGLTFKSPLLKQALATFDKNQVDEKHLLELLLLAEKLDDLLKDRQYQEKQYRYKPDPETGTLWTREGEPVNLTGKLQRWFRTGLDKTTRWYWLDYDKEFP
jgi:hypothetical protein